MLFKKVSYRFRDIFIVGPLTWLLIFPLTIIDLCMEIYHHICFPLLGIPLVPRKRYIRIDRYRLSYLNWLEKINCAYCGYANGLLSYASVIAAETERYWCGIKHAKYKGYVAPAHHKDFPAYNDKKAWEKKYISK